MKRTLALLLAVMLVFTTLYIPAKAEDNDLSDIFAFPSSDCYAAVQPTSALHLDDNDITITADMLSPNYEKGVVDLPRLRQSYYYSIDTLNSEYYLGLSVYPTLYWTPLAVGTSTKLCIYNSDSGKLMHSFNVRADSGLEGIELTEFKDCSAGLVQALVDAGSDMRYYEGKTPASYDPSWHKDCIVMQQYIYSPDRNILDPFVPYTLKEFDNLAFEYSRRNISVAGLMVQNNIKEFINDQQGMLSTYLFAGSKTDQCYYDNNTGVATTVTTILDTEPLYSFIATDTRCCFYKVNTEVVHDSELAIPSENNSNKLTGTSSVLMTISNRDTGYTNYTPWSRWAWDMEYPIGVFMGYAILPDDTLTTVTDINVYSHSLMFAGVDPHFATLTIKPYPHQVTMNYYVQDPITGNYSLHSSERCDVENFGSYVVPTVPSKENYAADGWYTSVTLDTKFNKEMVDLSGTSTWNLYATYKWNGGQYRINYFNEMDDAFFLEEVYDLNQLPTLPTVTSTKFGYGFKEWLIVDSAVADTGEPYNPNTFAPERDRLYVLKAFWSDLGHVVDVTSSTGWRYVGEPLTKESINVVVSVPGTREQRTLTPDEFTISPDIVTQIGDNTFVITYTATGSQGICHITGVQANPVGIEATYTGGDTYVGTELAKGMFYVELRYNSGKSEVLNDFVITPDHITEVGDNPITIGYLDFVTNVNVKGIKREKPPAELLSISVSYIGGGLKVGDKLEGSDLLVKAKYSDNTEISLTSDKYQFAPNSFNSAGQQKITVVYGGLSTTCDVNVAEVATPNPSPQPIQEPQPTQQPPSPTQQPVTTTPQPVVTQEPVVTQTPQPTARPSGSGSGSTPTAGSSGSGTPITIVGTPKPAGTGVTPVGQGDINSLVEEIKEALGINKNDTWEHTTSIGYIRGSNIITDVMFINNSTNIVNTVDIKGLLDEMGDTQTQLTVDLINGASGNEITPEILSTLEEKQVALYINMISPLNENIALGRWIISGPGLDNTEVTLDPNITYEIVPKESDRLLYIALANINYPKGVSVQAYPDVGTFGDGELVRQYTCTVTKDNAHMQRAFTWEDTTNVINLSPHEYLYYALSNSVQPYPDRSSLLVELNEVSIEENPSGLEIGSLEPGGEDPDEGDEGDEGFDWGEDGDDGFDWGDDPVTPPPPAGIPTFVYFAVAGGILVSALLVTVVVILIVKKKKAPANLDDYDVDYSEQLEPKSSKKKKKQKSKVEEDDDLDSNYADDIVGEVDDSLYADYNDEE